jgi:phenylalanyl-tRNA synthetase beta subunit
MDLNAKVLEWLSREAAKSISKESQKYHLEGINRFLGTNFSQKEMMEIYTYLGNRCNHKKTMRFIESGYDLTVLTKETVIKTWNRRENYA